MHKLQENIVLAQAYIGYDVSQTLISIGMFAGRIIVVSSNVILTFVTMATKIYGRRRPNLKILTQ